MRAYLLLIDGTPEAASLIGALEGEGYRCAQARGPLKVRSLLDSEPIALIVWKEEPGNAEFASDILAECARHEALPIVQLFSGASPGTRPVSPQIRESLPLESAANLLLPAIGRFFDRPAEAGPRPKVPKTELAFRNVVATLRGRTAGEAESDSTDDGKIEAPVTSVNVAERESLASNAPAAPQNRSPVRWLAQLLPRSRS